MVIALHSLEQRLDQLDEFDLLIVLFSTRSIMSLSWLLLCQRSVLLVSSLLALGLLRLPFLRDATGLVTLSHNSTRLVLEELDDLPAAGLLDPCLLFEGELEVLGILEVS